MNALTHGLTAAGPPLLPDEDPEGFATLRAKLHGGLQPASVLEARLVEDAAKLLWRIARAERLEVAVLTQQVFERRRVLSRRDASAAAVDVLPAAYPDPAHAPDAQARAGAARARERAAEAGQHGDLAVWGHAYAERAGTLDKLQRYESQLRRHLARTLRELERMRTPPDTPDAAAAAIDRRGRGVPVPVRDAEG